MSFTQYLRVASVITINLKFIHRLKVLRSTGHKITHFGDVLPSQSLGIILKKLNPTLQKQKQQKYKIVKAKLEKKQKMVNLNKHIKTKSTLIFKNCSHVCIQYHCVQLSYTTQHRTVLIIIPLILQTIIIAHMVSTT